MEKLLNTTEEQYEVLEEVAYKLKQIEYLQHSIDEMLEAAGLKATNNTYELSVNGITIHKYEMLG